MRNILLKNGRFCLHPDSEFANEGYNTERELVNAFRTWLGKTYDDWIDKPNIEKEVKTIVKKAIKESKREWKKKKNDYDWENDVKFLDKISDMPRF